jgi:hypothetical protein
MAEEKDLCMHSLSACVLVCAVLLIFPQKMLFYVCQSNFLASNEYRHFHSTMQTDKNSKTYQHQHCDVSYTYFGRLVILFRVSDSSHSL